MRARWLRQLFGLAGRAGGMEAGRSCSTHGLVATKGRDGLPRLLTTIQGADVAQGFLAHPATRRVRCGRATQRSHDWERGTSVLPRDAIAPPVPLSMTHSSPPPCAAVAARWIPAFAGVSVFRVKPLPGNMGSAACASPLPAPPSLPSPDSAGHRRSVPSPRCGVPSTTPPGTTRDALHPVHRG